MTWDYKTSMRSAKCHTKNTPPRDSFSRRARASVPLTALIQNSNLSDAMRPRARACALTPALPAWPWVHASACGVFRPPVNVLSKSVTILNPLILFKRRNSINNSLTWNETILYVTSEGNLDKENIHHLAWFQRPLFRKCILTFFLSDYRVTVHSNFEFISRHFYFDSIVSCEIHIPDFDMNF